MRIIIAKDYQELSKRAADMMASQIRVEGHTVLGLATGSTPVGAYKELVRQYEEDGLDFSNVDTFNLDEYYGLSPDHEQSYRYFMNDKLLNHINIDAKRTHVPNGLAKNPQEECAQYDQMIEALGGIDFQLLGMGNNGHIGFNEPNDCFIAKTNLVNLTQDTIEANSRFFDSAEQVPKQALTMGFGAIMRAKKVLFVVSGKSKAKVVAKALQGDVTPQIPASILQLHKDVIVILDEAAAAELK